jgi:hypothetical protein
MCTAGSLEASQSSIASQKLEQMTLKQHATHRFMQAQQYTMTDAPDT